MSSTDPPTYFPSTSGVHCPFVGRHAEDLSDRFFGRLYVKELAPKPWPGEHAEWICRCECGSLVMVQSRHLKNGRIRSCGCVRRRNVADQVFGRLTVLREAPRLAPGQETRWICRCECGKLKNVALSSLTSGNTRSCGCLAREVQSQNMRQLHERWREENALVSR